MIDSKKAKCNHKIVSKLTEIEKLFFIVKIKKNPKIFFKKDFILMVFNLMEKIIFQLKNIVVNQKLLMLYYQSIIMILVLIIYFRKINLLKMKNVIYFLHYHILLMKQLKQMKIYRIFSLEIYHVQWKEFNCWH